MRATLLAWFGTFMLFVCVAHGNFETTDAGFTMHAARALWHRGDSALLTASEGGDHIGEQQGAAFIKRQEAAGQRKCGKIGANGHAYVWFPMGHVFLLAPFVPLGELAGAWLADADARFQQKVAPFAQSFVEGSPVAMQAVMSMLVPTLCIATSLLLLYRIARELTGNGRDAVWAALTIGLASQAFSVGREQLSDGPGLMLLLAALLPIVRLHQGRAGRWTAAWAGAMSGCAVLVRYQTAITVILFAAIVASGCRRRGSWRDLAAFALGGAPLLLLFLGTNYLRYSDPLETGYPAIGEWFQADFTAGLAKIFFAAGRGVMWCSPVLWIALPLAASRRHKVEMRWLAWALFLIPVAIFSTALGWQGGQAWAIRYVTPGVVALCALVLPHAAPWRHSPRRFWAVFAIGCLVSLTSVVAPVRGPIQLMSQALRADEQRAVAAGALDPGARTVDTADVGGWRLRYSPLLRNWAYASRVGPDAPGAGAASMIEAVYGVEAVTPEQARAPSHWADRGGRHLWWRFWGDLYDISGLLLVLPALLIGGLCAWLGWRRLAAEAA
ncbi:MAG: glycosyltransferase family 39 protein [Planctomycetota bacterium]|nr:glycosyltransferase family 39 protein [Planctomycetota bacterium]